MHITAREKEIIDLLITSSQRYTTSAIARFLDVSTRTIQRDLQSIEKVLANHQLVLTRNMHNEFLIEGTNENIFKLVQSLVQTETIDESLEQRKLRILLALWKDGFCKTQVLASTAGISVTTLATYLSEIEDFLQSFDIEIVRKRGVGIELTGSEQNKRLALARYYLYFFYEELVEEIFAFHRTKARNKRILHYFVADDLFAIEQIVYQVMFERQIKLTDHDFIGALIHIYIAADRTANKHLLANPDLRSSAQSELAIVENICGKLSDRFSFSFTEADKMELAIVLKSSKWQVMDTAAYDRADLNQLVTELMAYVSKEMQVNLTNDFSLHQGLLAHLEPSLVRLQENMGLFNPLKDEIKEKYPGLFMAIKQFFIKRFPHVEQIPEDEIAFIVLHFGSALVLSEEKMTLHALLICPTGIGTSKMLASRIKQEFTEISSVQTTSMKALQEEDLEVYDLVLSTVRLPFTELPYVLVSPLLYERDIEQIRGYIEQHVEPYTRQLSARGTELVNRELKSPSFEDVLNDLKFTYQSAEQIIRNFRVVHTEKTQIDAILLDMLTINEKHAVLSNKEAVLASLQAREKMAGLGIPETRLALYHCRDEDIKELSFQLTKLAEPIRIKGMNGKEMSVQTILLLLAPAEAHNRTLEMISVISANLIESKSTILMYEQANEQIIKKHLEDLLMQYLQAK